MSDGITAAVSFSFNIIVAVNTPPTFASLPVNQNVGQGSTITYALPAQSDVDGDPITLSTTYPGFVTFSANTYTISPSISFLGTYTVSITLSVGVNPAVPFSFDIILAANTPPTLVDADSDPVTLTQTIPAFVTYSPYTYTISPTISDSGTQAVSITLSDGINTGVPFSFNIIITANTPPTFRNNRKI